MRIGGRHAETGSRGSVCARLTDGQAASDKVDTAEADEVIDAIAKTVAELTSQQDDVIRQQVIEQLMRQITHYDREFRRQRRDLRSQRSREGLTAVRVDLTSGPNRPHPHAGQAGGWFGGARRDGQAASDAKGLQKIRLSSDVTNPLSRSRN